MSHSCRSVERSANLRVSKIFRPESPVELDLTRMCALLGTVRPAAATRMPEPGLVLAAGHEGAERCHASRPARRIAGRPGYRSWLRVVLVVVAVAHRRLGPSSSVTTSTTERALPSSAVQLRCWRRPTTTTRLPFDRGTRPRARPGRATRSRRRTTAPAPADSTPPPGTSPGRSRPRGSEPRGRRWGCGGHRPTPAGRRVTRQSFGEAILDATSSACDPQFLALHVPGVAWVHRTKGPARFHRLRTGCLPQRRRRATVKEPGKSPETVIPPEPPGSSGCPYAMG
jgi:hypothetical protein